MKKLRRALFASIGLLALTVVAALAGAQTLKLSACHVDPLTKAALRCGQMLVPENPREPNGRRIKLHVVVVPALKPDVAAVPLFDLAGGPGLPATGAVSFYLKEGRMHRERRPVVLVDQRGTGESSPLRCPELELIDPLGPMYPGDAVARCRKVLGQHADMSQYTTANAAADLDAVRAALGYRKIDLMGLSYGTRVAVAYMRLYPQSARAAVLLGTVGEEAKLPLWHARHAQTTLDDVLGDCERDAACNAAFANIRNDWQTLLKHIDAGVSVERAGGKVSLQRGPFMEVLRGWLMTTGGQRRLPQLIRQMSGGDFSALMERATVSQGVLAEGLYLATTCAEDTPFITPAERDTATRGTFLGTYRIDEQQRACKALEVPMRPLPPPVPLKHPVLFIAGDRDHVTPPAWAEQVARSFPASRVLTVAKLSHFPDGLDNLECIDLIAAQFFARGKVAGLDTGCLSTLTPPPFSLK